MDVDAPTLARARLTRIRPNLSFVEGDAMTFALVARSFDFIALVATLHHLPLEPALKKLRDLLRPGGVLAVIGLYRSHTLSDMAWAIVAVPVSWWWRLTRNYEEIAPPIRDPDDTLEEVRTTVRRILPGATFRRELLFRYSILWSRPLTNSLYD